MLNNQWTLIIYLLIQIIPIYDVFSNIDKNVLNKVKSINHLELIINDVLDFMMILLT